MLMGESAGKKIFEGEEERKESLEDFEGVM
jgi:hypothetical protein